MKNNLKASFHAFGLIIRIQYHINKINAYYYNLTIKYCAYILYVIHLCFKLPYQKYFGKLSSIIFNKKRNIPAISALYFKHKINFISMILVKIGGSIYIPSNQAFRIVVIHFQFDPNT